MTRHQIIRVLPAWKRFDAIKPGGDVLVLSRYVETEFVRRIIEIADQRNVGDRGAFAQDEGRLRQALVHNRKRVVDAALEKREHLRMPRWSSDEAQEAIRTEIAVDLLVIEDDPAQCIEPLLFPGWLKLAETIGEIRKDRARLAELAVPVHQDRHLTHFIDAVAVLGGALLALDEKVHEFRLPIGAEEVEHQRRAIGIARLGEAIELILGHLVSSYFGGGGQGRLLNSWRSVTKTGAEQSSSLECCPVLTGFQFETNTARRALLSLILLCVVTAAGITSAA